MNNQYCLIKSFPGSAPKGTIFVQAEDSPSLFKSKNTDITYIYSLRTIMFNPKYFSPFLPKKLHLGMGVIFTFVDVKSLTRIPLIYETNSTVIKDGVSCILIKELFPNPNNPSTTLSIDIFNSRLGIDKQNIIEFDSLEEAERYFYDNVTLFTIKDISKVYKTANNPDYYQNTQLKEIVNSKLKL